MACGNVPVKCEAARLAQSVERKTLNLVVVGSSPTVGDYFLIRFGFVNLIFCFLVSLNHFSMKFPWH